MEKTKKEIQAKSYFKTQALANDLQVTFPTALGF